MFHRIVRAGIIVCIGMALLAGLSGCPVAERDARLNDIPQAWIRLALEATRAEAQGPTVEARKLWHASAAMSRR